MRPTTQGTPRRFFAAFAALSCSVVLFAGCGGDEDESGAAPSDDPTSVAPSTSSPEPTEPTPDPITPEDVAAAEAEQTVRDYVEFTDELVVDDTVDLERLDAFLQDPELTDRRDFFQQFREQGLYSQGGSTTFEWVRPTKVRLYPKKGEAAVSMTACLNLEDVDVRRKSGEALDLLSPALGTFEVYNYDYPSPTGWKIAVESAPGKRCKS